VRRSEHLYQTRPHFFAAVAGADVEEEEEEEEEEADMLVMLVVVKRRSELYWSRGCWRCRAEKDEGEDEEEDSARAKAAQSLVLGRAAADAVALMERRKNTRFARAAGRKGSPNMHVAGLWLWRKASGVGECKGTNQWMRKYQCRGHSRKMKTTHVARASAATPHNAHTTQHTKVPFRLSKSRLAHALAKIHSTTHSTPSQSFTE